MCRIHVYTVLYNEERLLPYFLRHYGALAEKIVCFDNMSTDASASIIDAHPVTERITHDTGGQFFDRVLLEMKHQYRQSRGKADWVMVVDIDEFLYHPRLPELLKHYREHGINFPKVTGYEMVGEEFPASSGQIYSEIGDGTESEWFDKRVVFNPELDVTWQPGCHKIAAVVGDVRESERADIKLLHYAASGRQFWLERQMARRQRNSAENIARGWSTHYAQPDDYFAEVFDYMRSVARPIV